MGSRKRISSEHFKKVKKQEVSASLQGHFSSPRKMRLMVDLIRNMNVDRALDVLKYSKKQVSNSLHDLLLSCLANWQLKNQDKDIEEEGLYISLITVGDGRTLKRLRPAPQGRGHKVRKRFNHVRINITSRNVENY
ncbi:MAG: 50S ribosomal protein L22 [Flavobacteriales bacterium Tduv]